MTRIGKLRGSLLLAVVLAAGLTAALLATRSSNASGAKTRQVVKVMRNPTLGKRILVTRGGMTLYSLSAERHGRSDGEVIQSPLSSVLLTLAQGGRTISLRMRLGFDRCTPAVRTRGLSDLWSRQRRRRQVLSRLRRSISCGDRLPELRQVQPRR